MGMPVKLSDELVPSARIEAEGADRSITAQIEHWAKLGRAAEVALGYTSVTALKRSGGKVATVAGNLASYDAVTEMLTKLVSSVDRREPHVRSLC
jgi:ParD-like antitoxin of type II bacterial toxin-antitoxin system